jgi:hypothetical protein
LILKNPQLMMVVSSSNGGSHASLTKRNLPKDDAGAEAEGLDGTVSFRLHAQKSRR